MIFTIEMRDEAMAATRVDRDWGDDTTARDSQEAYILTWFLSCDDILYFKD